MGQPRFLPVILLSVLLLTFYQGFARDIKAIVVKDDKPTTLLKANGGVAREMIEWDQDYEEPEPNFNSRSGYLNISPPHPHSPAPSPKT